MRFLHTSDWHLGHTLYGFDRSFEHQRFLDWLLQTISDERPDALLIAGDVFDNANPSAAAQHQLYRFLGAARDAAPELAIVIVAGNHDSPARLEAATPLLQRFDVTVIGHIHRDAAGEIDVGRLVVPLRRKGGGIAAWCLAIPYLRPCDVPRVEDAADPYLDGVAELYRRAFAAALQRREPGQAILAMGHCHMTSAQVSENSERPIVVGGAEALPANVFDARIAYAALGHLHLAQAVGGREHLRYSGSPLPLSFSELNYRHQVVCVDLEGEAAAGIRPIPVPRAVELLRIPPRHAPIDEVLPQLTALDLPEAAGRSPLAHPYLEVRVRLDAPEPGLRARIEAALADKPVRLARIDASAVRGEADTDPAASPSLADLERLSPEDVFARLCAQKIGADAPDRDALLATLQAAFLELATQPADIGNEVVA